MIARPVAFTFACAEVHACRRSGLSDFGRKRTSPHSASTFIAFCPQAGEHHPLDEQLHRWLASSKAGAPLRRGRTRWSKDAPRNQACRCTRVIYWSCRARSVERRLATASRWSGSIHRQQSTTNLREPNRFIERRRPNSFAVWPPPLMLNVRCSEVAREKFICFCVCQARCRRVSGHRDYVNSMV